MLVVFKTLKSVTPEQLIVWQKTVCICGLGFFCCLAADSYFQGPWKTSFISVVFYIQL